MLSFNCHWPENLPMHDSHHSFHCLSHLSVILQHCTTWKALSVAGEDRAPSTEAAAGDSNRSDNRLKETVNVMGVVWIFSLH